MVVYSQRDPRWRGELLGTSGQTVGRYGCTITCIAMLSTYFGDNFTPRELARSLKFTRDGRIIWSSVTFPSFKFYHRSYIQDDGAIMHHLKDKDKAVILEVANKSHWVTAIGYNPILQSYRIADPLYGDKSTMRRYQNNITGAAYFKRV